MEPMLLSASAVIPRGPRRALEPKWDGFRALARIQGGRLLGLRSRRGSDLRGRFPRLATALAAALPQADLLLDGEIVVPPGDVASFEELLRGAGGRRSPIDVAYVAFDLLARDGRDLTPLPYRERRAQLEATLAAALEPPSPLFLSPVFSDGEVLFELVASAGGEGIVAKDVTSPWVAGRRSSAWLKIKTVHARRRDGRFRRSG